MKRHAATLPWNRNPVANNASSMTAPGSSTATSPGKSRPQPRPGGPDRQRWSVTRSWGGLGGGKDAQEKHGMLALRGSRCGTSGRAKRCAASSQRYLSGQRLPRLWPAWQPASAKEVQRASPCHCDHIAKPPPAGLRLNRTCHRRRWIRTGRGSARPLSPSARALGGRRRGVRGAPPLSPSPRQRPEAFGSPCSGSEMQLAFHQYVDSNAVSSRQRSNGKALPDISRVQGIVSPTGGVRGGGAPSITLHAMRLG